MRVLKEGKLPAKPSLVLLQGTCFSCGCEVEDKYLKESLRESGYYASVPCPTNGCCSNITLMSKPLKESLQKIGQLREYG